MENQQTGAESLWKMLGEEYSDQIERTSAILVKESDAAPICTYQGEPSRSEFCFQFSDQTGYDTEPDFKFEFGAFSYPTLSQTVGENHRVFQKSLYYPSYIRREFRYTNIGLFGTEKMGQAVDGGLAWRIHLRCVTEQVRLEKKLISVVRFRVPCRFTREGDGAELWFLNRPYHISCNENAEIGMYPDEHRMMSDLSEGKVGGENGEGFYLVISNSVSLGSGGDADITFGLSSSPAPLAAQARLAADHMEENIAARWDGWFASLPSLPFADDREKRAYYKSWWTIRSNYYEHPRWGFCVMEAILFYKGVWQWAMPSVEMYSDQDSDHTSVWIKKAMDMFVDNQRADGYVTHAIYVDDKKPGERWLQDKGIVQTPYLPSVALRYYDVTGDRESIVRWYPHFERYYQYLCSTRDACFENLHLWAILTSFDTGHDTAPVFQRVTYGENGQKEDYCYPAIFASQRIAYELSMARLARLLGKPCAGWQGEAEKTARAMERYLWDTEKCWYGIRHQDSSLDTRVGVDGLYPFAYRFADPARAELIRSNFEKLIGDYGVRTLVEGEPGYREDIYWRGPAWSKSCALAAAICRNYFPDLTDRVRKSVCNMALSHPNIWECYVARTGELARSDMGFVCAPAIASNVGAGGVIESILACHGFDLFGREPALPLTGMSRFHWGGLRVSLRETGQAQWEVSARMQEKRAGDIRLCDPSGRASPRTVSLSDGQSVRIRR